MKLFLLNYILFPYILIANFANCNEIKQRTFTGFDGTIAAFGDFNSDKYTDIFLIRNDFQNCFQIIKQSTDKDGRDVPVFQDFKSDSLKKLCIMQNTNPIVSILPSDFDGDAQMDVAVVTKKSENLYDLYVFKGLLDRVNQDSILFTNTNITSIPMLLDLNGDMISDLLVTEIDKETKNSFYCVYLGGKEFIKVPFDEQRKNISIKNPNSNAFIDLDKDGVADIFLEEQEEMHYYYADKNGYSHKSKETIKRPGYEIIGASTFCDINSDEEIDHLLPVCKKKNDKKSCSIIVYDKKHKKWVELIKEIKVGNYYFYFEEGISSNGKQKIDLPIRLRHGYVNENGYTDLMALMKSNENNKWHVVLFNNRKDDNNPNELNISFKITALNETMDGQPILASFFDLYEDGVIDILVNYKKPDKDQYEFKSLTLNDFADVNFVKILVTSGLCLNGECYKKGPYVGEDTYLTPFGANYPGSMVCYQLVNSNGNVMKSCGGQLSQTSNFALQMPYNVFGLGLYANYIEKLIVTIPSGNSTDIFCRKVEQIVPDSQIVIIPNPVRDPSSWKVKLYLTPSDIIYKTLYTLTGICVILIVIIGVLHRKEMLEDVKEQAEFKKQWPEYRR